MSCSKRQPPAKQGHRLKLLYMTQIGTSPPRFAIQVNSRARVTRDYAYFIENRMRARYGLEAFPGHRLRRARVAAIAGGPGSGARGGRGPGRGRPQAGRRERAAEGPEEVEDDRREL